MDTAPLKKGDVVSCRFPLAETPNTPGPTARPALVVATFLDRETNTHMAIMAYGTSRRTRANAGFEIRINRPDGLNAAGLNQPTRFTLSRMRALPITDAYFCSGNRKTPILGHLDAGLRTRLESICETIAKVSKELAPLNGSKDAHARTLDRYMRTKMTGSRDFMTAARRGIKTRA